MGNSWGCAEGLNMGQMSNPSLAWKKNKWWQWLLILCRVIECYQRAGPRPSYGILSEGWWIQSVIGKLAFLWSHWNVGRLLLNRLGIECVENKIQRGRLRWFGHVERKEENNWVKKCTRMNVIGVVDRGAPRKTWRSCVKRDMKAMGIKEEMAQDRCAWRNITGGPTRASADAWNTVCVLGSRTLNEYDDDDDAQGIIYGCVISDMFVESEHISSFWILPQHITKQLIWVTSQLLQLSIFCCMLSWTVILVVYLICLLVCYNKWFLIWFDWNRERFQLFPKT